MGTPVAVCRRMRTFIFFAIVQLTSIFTVATAHADWLPVLSGPVTRVVAAGKYAAVLRRGEVLILGEDGGLVFRAAEKTAAGDGRKRSDHKTMAEATLDRLEIPEIDRDSDYTDDLVDDESRLGQRRSWRLAGKAEPLYAEAVPEVLAASSTDIWLGNDRGLYRVGDDGALVRRYPLDRPGPHLAAAGRLLAIDRGASIEMFSLADASTSVTTVQSQVEHLAVSPAGRLAWTTGRQIWETGPSGSARFEATGPAVDLAFCGETVVALLATGLVAIAPQGRGEMRSAPPQARRVVCPAGPSLPWLAVGEGLWMSSDQGQQWTAVAGPSGASLFDVAVSDHHVWLASKDGVFMSVDGIVHAEARAEAKNQTSNGALRRRLSWLSGMLPKVSVRAAATFSPGAHQIEGFAFAAFPLGSETAPPRATGTPDVGVAEVRVESRVEPALDLRDAEADCLVVARRKAIELAMTEPERARSYVTRAGHAAWLPELRVLVSRRYGRSESLDISGSASDPSSPLGIDTVNDIRYEARATWDLARLVFSSDELAAQAQAIHMAELRRDIETTVNRLYFERRRLRVLPPGAHAERAGQALRSQEVEADLDALSAGTFGTCVAGRSVGTQ